MSFMDVPIIIMSDMTLSDFQPNRAVQNSRKALRLRTGVPENRTSPHITAHHTAHHHTSTAHHQKSRYRGINANADITLAFHKQDSYCKSVAAGCGYASW